MDWGRGALSVGTAAAAVRRFSYDVVVEILYLLIVVLLEKTGRGGAEETDNKLSTPRSIGAYGPGRV